MNKEQFGAFIAQRRRDLEMTQRMLADKLHVTDKAVSKWERGLSFPDLTLLEPLSSALELTVTELMSCSKQRDNEERSDHTAQILLDVGKASIQRQKRKLRLLLAIAALIVITAIGFWLDYYFASTGEPVETQVYYKQEIGEDNYLYVEDGSHLVRLRCDQEVYDAIKDHKDLRHFIRYRWNRFTYEGVLEEHLPEQELEIAGTSMDTVGSEQLIGSMLGFDSVTKSKTNVYPDPNRETGCLYTVRFSYAGEDPQYIGRLWLLIRDCRNYVTGDFDDDGIVELLVQTRYEEEPYMLYDVKNGEIVYRFADLPSYTADSLLWFEPYYP